MAAGYDVPHPAFLPQHLPGQVLGRIRADRVLRRAAPAASSSSQPRSTGGVPDTATVTVGRLHDTAAARAWDRRHPRLTHRSAWAAELGTLLVIEGTVIRREVGYLPSGAVPEPLWLWWSGTGAAATDVDRLGQAFLRRFDIEHTVRLWKQTLSWACPKIRTPEAADRWTWLILAVCTRLCWPARWPPTGSPSSASAATRLTLPARGSLRLGVAAGGGSAHLRSRRED